MNLSIPKKYQGIINSKSIDVDLDGTITVWLNFGYAYEPHQDPKLASHVRSYDSWKDAVKDLAFVEDCNCTDCAKYTKGKIVGGN